MNEGQPRHVREGFSISSMNRDCWMLVPGFLPDSVAWCSSWSCVPKKGLSCHKGHPPGNSEVPLTRINSVQSFIVHRTGRKWIPICVVDHYSRAMVVLDGTAHNALGHLSLWCLNGRCRDLRCSSPPLYYPSQIRALPKYQCHDWSKLFCLFVPFSVPPPFSIQFYTSLLGI